MSSVTQQRQHWLDALMAANAAASEASREPLIQQGLPPQRQEDWRFTDLSALLALDPAALQPRGAAATQCPAPASGVVRLQLDGTGAALQLADGSAPLPQGLQLNHGSAPLGRPEGLPGRLHSLLAGPALQVDLAAGQRLQLELWLEPSSEQALLAPQLQITLGENAQLDLAVQLRCAGASLALPWVQAQVAAGARFSEGWLLQGDASAVLLAGSQVQQQPGSTYSRTAVVRGWALARQEPEVLQLAGAAHTQLRDLSITTGRAVHDLHSRVRFEGPEGTLDQLQKALVDEAGHSIFNGCVQVPQIAQRTDAAQLSRHLLLSERAKVDTKPELEIIADDVRCSHGATVSSLSDEELFYLRSRGIDRDTGAALLRRGFCAEILRELPPLLAAEAA